MELIGWAEKEPDITFYVTAVGFETTLPIYALMLQKIMEKGLRNIRFLTAVKALMPALCWICENDPAINGFIGPGHVSTIIGESAYEPFCRKYGIPLTIAGFGFEHIIAAIYDLITQCRRGTSEVHNLYPNAVSKDGNTNAAALISGLLCKEAFFLARARKNRGFRLFSLAFL